MGLAERERAAKPVVVKGPMCSVQQACFRLSQDDADALHRLVFKRLDLTAAQVERILAEEEIDLPQHNISRHRRGSCRSCRKG